MTVVVSKPRVSGSPPLGANTAQVFCSCQVPVLVQSLCRGKRPAAAGNARGAAEAMLPNSASARHHPVGQDLQTMTNQMRPKIRIGALHDRLLLVLAQN